MASALADSGVRGLAYEAAGTVDGQLLAEGAAIVGRVGRANRMPVEIVEQHPRDLEAWAAAVRGAVERVRLRRWTRPEC